MPPLILQHEIAPKHHEMVESVDSSVPGNSSCIGTTTLLRFTMLFIGIQDAGEARVRGHSAFSKIKP